MIVNTGKKFLREYIAGSTEWQTDVNMLGKRYMGAGISTNTNQSVIGPTIAQPINASGYWQGPANSDFKLTNEATIVRPECSFSVGANGTIHVQAIFQDSDFTDGATTDYDLFEFGIFLHSGEFAGNNPVDFPSAANKERAMVSRIVNVYLDVPNYKTWAYPKLQGIPLIVNFDLIDFGA